MYYEQTNEDLEGEKLRLEIAKLKRERIQGWGNAIFKTIIAVTATGTLLLRAWGKI